MNTSVYVCCLLYNFNNWQWVKQMTDNSQALDKYKKAISYVSMWATQTRFPSTFGPCFFPESMYISFSFPSKEDIHLISWKKYIFLKKNSWELPMGSKIKEKLKSLICKVTVTLNMECKK